MLYAGAIQAIVGGIKRAAKTHESTAEVHPHTWSLITGAVTGPVVWPWLWLVAGLEEAIAPSLLQGAILGVGTAGVASLAYPLVTERLARAIRP